MARLIGNVDATGSLSTSVPAPATNASAVSLYVPFDSDIDDTSANSHTGTAIGNAAISSTQAKFGSNSAYFDGTGDVITYPRDTVFQLGSGDFTIEAFVYRTSSPTYGVIAAMWTGSGNRRSFIFRFNGNNPYFYWSTSGSSYSSQAFTDLTASLNTWHHVAFVRSGTSGFCFLDGVKSSNTANLSTNTLYYPDAPLSVGALNTLSHSGGQNNYAGYIDDLRITKGFALYTQNFVPPSQAVGASLSGTNETNSTTDFTSLYLTFDSSVTADDSPINHSITANGGVNISSTQAKFGSYSAAFDGSDDQLTFLYDTGQYFGTGDFSFECFVYISAYSSGYWPIIYLGQRGATGFYQPSFGLGFENSGGKLRSIVGGTYIDHNAVTINTGQWIHVAACRAGGVYRTFINGQLHGSTANTSNVSSSSNNSVIGGANFGGGNGTFYSANGYIDDLRLLNGFAKYTSEFTPPTAAVTATVSQTRNDLAVLYMPFDDGLEDKARTHAVTANGNAAISATQAKFGGKSLYLDGNGDYLTIPHSGEFNFKGENFSLEAWVYPTALNSNQGVFSKWGSNGAKTLKLTLNSSGNVKLQASKDGSTGSQISVTSSAACALNTWTHIAATRSGDVYTVYVNGSSSGTQTVSGDLYESTSDVGIGANRADQSSNLFTGYIDDLLCVVGFAKTYGSAPTAASGGEVLDVATDTRTFSSVWNLNSPEVTEAFKAGTWPTNIDTQYTLFYASFDTNANDESAAGLTATLSGNANIQSSTAKFGSALDVDGSGDFVTYSDGVALGATDFTLEHWLYLNTTSSGNEVLVANYLNSSVKGWMWRLFGNNANSLGFSYNDGAWRHFYVNSSIITNNQWHHVACVYDQAAHSMAIYLDGVAQTVVTSNVGSEIGAAARDTNVLTISKLDGYTQEFDGQMDDLMILNTKRYTANFTPPTAASGGGV